MGYPSFETATALLKNDRLEKVEAETIIEMLRFILTAGAKASPPVRPSADAAADNSLMSTTNIAAGHDGEMAPTCTGNPNTSVGKTTSARFPENDNPYIPRWHDECDISPQKTHSFDAAKRGPRESEDATFKRESKGGDVDAETTSNVSLGRGVDGQALCAINGRAEELDSGHSGRAEISPLGDRGNWVTSTDVGYASAPHKQHEEHPTDPSGDKLLASYRDVPKTELDFHESAEASTGVLMLVVSMIVQGFDCDLNVDWDGVSVVLFSLGA